jgi:hypothetical protein
MTRDIRPMTAFPNAAPKVIMMTHLPASDDAFSTGALLEREEEIAEHRDHT